MNAHGGLAQLARAPALQAGGHRFEPDILHHMRKHCGVIIHQQIKIELKFRNLLMLQ